MTVKELILELLEVHQYAFDLEVKVYSPNTKEFEPIKNLNFTSRRYWLELSADD